MNGLCFLVNPVFFNSTLLDYVERGGANWIVVPSRGAPYGWLEKRWICARRDGFISEEMNSDVKFLKKVIQTSPIERRLLKKHISDITKSLFSFWVRDTLEKKGKP